MGMRDAVVPLSFHVGAHAVGTEHKLVLGFLWYAGTGCEVSNKGTINTKCSWFFVMKSIKLRVS
jgi:hypothetical protein